MKSFLRKISGWPWLVLATYLIITAIIAFNHQPWRDEAQAWLIARDLGPWQIIRQMPYEGTPPLWHFLLYPLASSGAPYASMFLLNYLIAAAAIYLLIFRSPLPKAVKILLPFSFLFLFEYPIVARNYALTVLCLFAVASLYQRRLQKPLLYALAVGALCWSDVLTEAFAFVLLLMFLKDLKADAWKNRRGILGAGLIAAFLATAALMLIPYPGQAYGSWKYTGLEPAVRALAFALFPVFQDFRIPSPLLWLAASLWIPLTAILLRSRRALLLFLGNSAWMIFIFSLKYGGEVRHFGIFLTCFLAAWWIGKIDRPDSYKGKNGLAQNLGLAALSGILTVGILYSAYYCYHYRNYYFSGAKEMAGYLRASGLVSEDLASFQDRREISLLPYLPGKELFMAPGNSLGKLMPLDGRPQTDGYQNRKNNIVDFYRRKNPGMTSVLAISNEKLPEDPDLSLIKETSRQTVKDEHFFLYRLRLRN